ncbi:MAG TPA: hypothetical protein EYG68_00680 [Leucothrix mucor]|nr:hypothetical protein [Leucothrix mucor]
MSETPSNIEFTAPDDSKAFLNDELTKKQEQLQQLASDADPLERAGLQYDMSEIMLDLATAGMSETAWNMTKQAFNIYMENQQWEDAVHCCDLLYRTEQPSSIVALGNGLWLAITYPIDPELTIIMLNNLIDDTPAKADGAAVAAVSAHYIADLRLEGKKRDSIQFLTMNIIAKVAERHSNVSSQDQMNFWMDKLELNDPKIYLPRLAQVIDAIVGETWWYDRDALRTEIPTN